MKNIKINLVLVNNHFHDNEVFAQFEGKLFQDPESLIEKIGYEYMDFEGVQFIYKGKEINTEDAIDIWMY